MTRIDAPDCSWPTQLWAELDIRAPQHQFITAGDWITYITQTLLPELGIRRRENVLELLSLDGSTVATVAAQLGMRRSTVARLVEEGRSARKHQRELLAASDAQAA